MAFYAQKDPRIKRFDVTAALESNKEEAQKSKAILEDYLLDDEMPKKGPKTPPMPAPGAANIKWQPVSTGSETKMQQQPPVQQVAGGYPPPSYPPSYDQSGQPAQHYPPQAPYYYNNQVNQYDYSQQQQHPPPQQAYPGYNYYPGYGAAPVWGPPPGLPPTAVPPPGIPDLTKPPPGLIPPVVVQKAWSPKRREERGRDKSRDREERGRDRDKSRDRSRERDKSRERHRERGRERERHREKERAHSRDREREHREKEKAKESRGREREREKEKEIVRSRDASTESHKKLVEEVKTQKGQYVKQFELLKRELKVLKDQQSELMQDNVKESSQFLKENLKLQDEVKKKLVSIGDLVGKLDSVLNKNDKLKRKKKGSRSRSKDRKRENSSSSSSDNDSEKVSKESEKNRPKYNLKFFDPEEYWCRVCNIFPDNAKEYLHHLHSQEHKHAMAEINLIEAAWHDYNPEKPRGEIDGAPEKRVPIRGLQFLIAATAWYCKLCHKWMGDLHCTSLHLKSDLHINNVEAYFEDDPEWETTWRKDREKALKQAMQEAKGKKSKPTEPEDVSTSSKFTPRSENSYQDKPASPKLDEENAKSIRVAMRNQPKMPPMGPAIPPNHPLCHPISKPSAFWEKVGQPAKVEKPKEEDERRVRSKRSGTPDSYEARRKSRGRRSRSRSHDRHRRSRSRERWRRGRSKSPSPKKEIRKWVDIPSSPPPYIVRKVEEKDKVDKLKKKTPTVPRALPKSKFGFIGKMPVLKAKKKAEDNEVQRQLVSGDPYEYYAYNAFVASNNEATSAAAEQQPDAEEIRSVDMEVDNGDEIANGSEATPKMERSRRIEDMDEMTLLGIDPEDIMAQQI